MVLDFLALHGRAQDMSDPIRVSQNAMQLVLGAGRDTSGRVVLESWQEQLVQDALAIVQGHILAPSGFAPGAPPEGVESCWLMLRHEHSDGDVDSAVLAVRDGDDWCESGDWKGESTLDSVHVDGGRIVGWKPFAVPRAVLAQT